MTSLPDRLPELADAADREKARTEFAHPLVLEAGAGTGKTAVLVARALTWVLGQGWTKAERRAHEHPEEVAARVLERVVAITFTNRGAAEMAQRVGEALAAVHEGREIPGLSLEVQCALVRDESERRRRAAALLASLDRLFVGTIHSFCQRILAAHPLEAGLHPGFQVDDGSRRLRAIAEEVLADHMRNTLGDPGDPEAIARGTTGGGTTDAGTIDPDTVELVALGFGPASFLQALCTLVEKGVPPEAPAGEAYDAAALLRFRDELAAHVARVLELIRGPFGTGRAGRVSHVTTNTLLEITARLEQVTCAESLAAVTDGEGFEKACERLKAWSEGRFGNTESELLGKAQGELEQLSARLLARLRHLERLEPARFALARRVLRPLLEDVRRRMRAQGVETFIDLLADARDLLTRHDDVCSSIRRSIDQLLVDEFQDTDPIQCILLAKLALEGPAGERPGLFLVGDPKQSIYGWREADLGAYERFLAKVRSQGGTFCELSVNFRSDPPILAEVERLIAGVMRKEPGVQPPFKLLTPAPDKIDGKGFREGGRYPIEHWVSWREAGGEAAQRKKSGPGTTAEEACKLEASAIAADLVELHGVYGVAWRDVAILLRTKSHQEEYLQALREASIPFVVERDRSYYRRREIVDVACALRCIADPGDDLALVAFLRSSVVGVPDAAWLPLKHLSFLELMRDLLEPDLERFAALDQLIATACAETPSVPGLERVAGWGESLKVAVRALAALRRSLREDPADLFVDKLRGFFLAEETEAARYLGTFRLANLERFYRRLLDALIAPEGGVQAILRELREGIAQVIEEEEGVVGDESFEAVRVLTIHKAKGLTFEHVYVVGLHTRGRAAARRSSDAEAIDGAFVDGSWQLELFGARSLDFDRVLERRDRVEKAELVRTLYVATTRPAKRLVLAGRWPAADRHAEAGSHMRLLEERRGDRPGMDAMLAKRERGETSCRVTDDAVRWVITGELAGRAASGERTGAHAVDLERARREMQHLAEARKVAAARMALPCTATVSRQSHEAEQLAHEGDELLPREETGASGEEYRIERDNARVIGTAVHRVLETFDLEGDLGAEIERQVASLPAILGALALGAGCDAALREATALVRRLASSPLLGKLRDLRSDVLGREVPIVLRPTGLEGAVGAVVGTLDLLYRDGTTGGLVVADYKTDDVASEEALRERVAAYAGQGRLYVKAVAEALDATPPPRFELWFLRADRVVEVPLEAPSSDP
ncbi:MAG: UvrD-helicase domain-containing protein [Planctomycetota bacterium]